MDVWSELPPDTREMSPIKVMKKSELTTLSEEEQERYRQLEQEEKEAEILQREQDKKREEQEQFFLSSSTGGKVRNQHVLKKTSLFPTTTLSDKNSDFDSEFDDEMPTLPMSKKQLLLY